MAWNTLTYACGHQEEKQLYGKMTERERIVAAAAHHDCPACRAEKAKVADQAAGLPALQGSEKQIGWASECRARLIPQIEAAIERGQAAIAKIDAGEFADRATPEQCATERARLEAAIAKAQAIKAITRAGYWIDNRSSSVAAMVATHN